MASNSSGFMPDLSKFIRFVNSRPLEASIEYLVSLFKRRQITGPKDCAVATAHLLFQVVKYSKWSDEEQLMAQVCRVGKRLADALPKELAIVNIVRRVLSVIHDEANEDRDNDAFSDTASEVYENTQHNAAIANANLAAFSSKHICSASIAETLGSIAPPRLTRQPTLSTISSFSTPKSLFNILSASPSGTAFASPTKTSGTSTPHGPSKAARADSLRSEIMNAIEEMKDEIDQVAEQIASFAEAQIRPGDYVLVHEPSSVVTRFIVKAASKRRFTVLIACKAGPRGYEARAVSVGCKDKKHVAYESFRRELTKAGITVINVMASGMSTYMSLVTRVVLGARSILANGNVIMDAGAGAVAHSAKYHGRPVVVLGGIYQLSPDSPFDEGSLVEWNDPSIAVAFEDGSLVCDDIIVRQPLTEVLPAELVDMYISNLGTHCQNHLSSLIMEHYKAEDVEFHQW
ncbi:GCD complex subunit gcd7 [Ceratocystis pirilliformis]|uniref:Translation initiation factor eIF2B subunit beta n=1 Tax=Ceratocystis pirilliformis TaxID=259994 RepID=A0ABR3Z830_9PEZI